MEKKNAQWNMTIGSVGSRDQKPQMIQSINNKRSRSKPIEQYLTASVRSDGSDIGNESTTAGLTSENLGSPLINNKR